MLARQFIVALLSVLLLAGGPVVGAVPEQNPHAGMAMEDAPGCGGMSHDGVSAIDAPAAGCDLPKQSQCRISALQCSLAPVYALTAGPLWVPLPAPGQFVAVASRTAYQNPIPEVLTPPPDTFS